ncbi:Vault protein inter-alpha-trypsin domain [Popillia japonica]|uniref:Vault protein inter-alpha-trypsin domain n=1 Tax=Popillia japonica TaxID=7064 RepID=A0AAW1LQJ5_POPJA
MSSVVTDVRATTCRDRNMDFRFKIGCLLLLVAQIHSFPSPATKDEAFIVRRTRRDKSYDGKEVAHGVPTGPPTIYEMQVDSNITHRFAHTLVTSKVKNFADKAQETVFSIILPKEAFISKFVMSIGGKEYDAYVKEKQEAKQLYNQAIASGQTAGLVSANARESNRFTVAINVEPASKVIFYLTYEQLLQREDNQYELVINIHPKQPVADLRVNVNIQESQPLTFVNAPPIRSGNEINDIQGDLDPRAQIQMIDANSATVSFSPNVERQKELAKTLGTNIDEGLSGQFVVQYDVERKSGGGEILLNDGYFVHFFAPPGGNPLPKYVLFVLDTSGSMYGTKISQLKEAMKTPSSLCGTSTTEDKFHLIEFSTVVSVWDIHNEDNSVRYPSTEPSFFLVDNDRPKEDITLKRFPGRNDVNPDNIKDTIKLIDILDADGGTNIADALKVALYLVDVDKRTNPSNDAPQPMIIFLTDGEATVGQTESHKIVAEVQEENTHNVPIFSLSFGDGADKDLLQKLSLRNNGFSRHIYEAADASLQLQDFYKHISSPVLRNVTFKYVDDIKEVSDTTFPIIFEGSEIVVVGQIDKDKQLPPPTISATGIHGHVELHPEVRKPITRLERLWAYKTIQQLLEDMERADDKTQFERKALDLALKYSFVTPVSSLVVVKPNGTDTPIVPIPADITDSPVGQALGLAQPLNALYEDTQVNTRFDYQPVGLPAPPSYYGVPQVAATTTSRPPPTTTLTPIEVLKSELPWLGPILTNDNAIATYRGTYKLGLNETTTDDIPCPATPSNGAGVCRLLHECPEVHRLLTNVYIFQQYYCEMRGFAAVCCPHIVTN